MLTTSGQISVTPVRIRTRATLDQLQAAASDKRYQGVPGTTGWGSVRDKTDEFVAQPMRQAPKGGQPEPVLRPEVYPDQMRARLYWSEEDSTLVRAFGYQADTATTSRLRAADITFSEGVQEGELIGLLGERNDTRLRIHVIPAVEDLLKSIDQSASLSLDDNGMEFGDDDFFRWILYRATHDTTLSDDLEVLEVRAMSNQDMAYRPTNMSRGIAMDRPELLALVSGTLNRFGPAKFNVWSESLQLEAALEVNAQGQFSIYRGQSSYDNDDELNSEEEGLQLVQDVAFEILPELRRIHNADSDWVDTNRDAFTEEARQMLRAVLDAL